jgi:hypothetical protein
LNGPQKVCDRGKMVGKRCRTGAKIGCSMDGAANLADQNVLDMLPFVKDLTRKASIRLPVR